MSDNELSPTPNPLELAREHTPARVLVGRAGPAYRTGTWLKLREDHATARDAVQAETDLLSAFGIDRIANYLLFNARTRATSKAEYLLRPDLGRQLDDDSRKLIAERCPTARDLQVVIGDGLSATAVATQAPELLDNLQSAAIEHGWSFGQPFLVRYCRVGVMNDVGDLLNPSVIVLLIGERPGLATAESLSAYMAFRPRAGHTDADRNLISNIHARGIGLEEATRRAIAFAEQFRVANRSGVTVKEVLSAAPAVLG
ncbi:MAG: ethanolamine ammonia-lyase [Planctomycetaceae bacterium]|nr:ethanolamine ammonia-lyase [Planctomycetaceae bacterium]